MVKNTSAIPERGNSSIIKYKPKAKGIFPRGFSRASKRISSASVSVSFARVSKNLKTLEINDNNESLVTGYWKNPKSGNTGVIKIKGYYGKPNCRLIEHVYINQNNIAQNSYDTACRAESGQWAMIK